MYEFVCIANLQRKYHRICLYNNRAVEMCTYLSVCFNIEEEMSVYLTESLCLSVCMSVCLYGGPFFLLFFAAVFDQRGGGGRSAACTDCHRGEVSLLSPFLSQILSRCVVVAV